MIASQTKGADAHAPVPAAAPEPGYHLSASIPVTRSRHRHQLADVALAGPELPQQARHFRSPCYEPRESFSDHRLQHVLVQTQIGNQLLQPRVLIAQVLDLFGFVHFHAALLRLPGIDGLLADALFRNPVT